MLSAIGIGLAIAAVYSVALHHRASRPAGVEAVTQAGAPAAVQPAAPRASADEAVPGTPAGTTNFLERLLKLEELPKPSLEQITRYVDANRRSAGSLLAAFRTSGDREWLEEAMTRYPTDPRVAFATVFRSNSPEERRQWLEAFKSSAPENSMPHYLSALDCFKAGQKEQALREISLGEAKPAFDDYSMDFIQNAQEAYQAAGYSEAQAKAAATCQLVLPQLAQLKEVSQNLAELAKASRQAGDEAAAQALVQMGLTMGERVGSGQSFLINDLVGLAIEKCSSTPSTPPVHLVRTVKRCRRGWTRLPGSATPPRPPPSSSIQFCRA